MREIKFRQPMLDNGRFYCWHYWGFVDRCFKAPASCNLAIQEPEKNSLQFTGLKDKQGKEIYDRDIVKIDADELGTDEESICLIKWDGGCCYQVESDEAGTYSLADLSSSSMEVVGNVWENPELMND